MHENDCPEFGVFRKKCEHRIFGEKAARIRGDFGPAFRICEWRRKRLDWSTKNWIVSYWIGPWNGSDNADLSFHISLPWFQHVFQNCIESSIPRSLRGRNAICCNGTPSQSKLPLLFPFIPLSSRSPVSENSSKASKIKVSTQSSTQFRQKHSSPAFYLPKLLKAPYLGTIPLCLKETDCFFQTTWSSKMSAHDRRRCSWTFCAFEKLCYEQIYELVEASCDFGEWLGLDTW